MALFEWKSQYSVKVQSIDREHQKLFGMVNELHEAMESVKAPVWPRTFWNAYGTTPGNTLPMKEADVSAKYPDFAAHKAEHEKLNKEVSKMKKSLNEAILQLR